MRRILFAVSALLIPSLLLSACGKKTPATPQATATITPTEDLSGRIQIRWLIDMGTGTDPAKRTAELSVLDDFNKSQKKILLVQEFVTHSSFQSTLSAEIAAGKGPDIIGPMGWSDANAFHDQYLDLAPYIKSYGFDTSAFDPALLKVYETPQGTYGLPFAVHPSAIFYNTTIFNLAGMRYPPANYGDKYILPDGSQVDWTWDVLTAVAKLLTLDASGNNATQPGFDKTKITQYGFTWQNENQPSYWGSYWGNGSYMADDGKTAQAPDAWKAAWKWTYDSLWGDQPFAPNSAAVMSQDFGNGNPFNSNKVAMTEELVSYTCCMGNIKAWDIGIMPMYKDKTSGRIDDATFRIWKDTKHPSEAFNALAYLVTTGVPKLIIGSKDLPAAYNAVPARAADWQDWLDAQRAAFPLVKNWTTLLAGLSYPDVPSAEAYMPHYADAWARGQAFAALVRSKGGLDIEKEITTFISDLTTIFAKP